jgi:ribosomal protein S18 acetylase RimI-like enzyme
VQVLDNPVWHALAGPQATAAEGVDGLAVRYDPQVAPFAGLPDEPEPAHWDALARLVGRGGLAMIFRDVTAPPGWTEVFRVDARQMVATSVAPARCDGAVELGAPDVDDMLGLVARTEPGPFARRTVELGTYLGIRDGGRLVAMAGERVRPPGFSEISAVCTDASHRGRGLASALVRDLVGRIQGRGETAVLHVVATNTGAIRVYEALGFTHRGPVAGVGLQAPSTSRGQKGHRR